MKAVLLAGGKGTRLRPLTYTKPKPLLPLAGEPAIVRLIRKLAHGGIDEIVVTNNYFATLVRSVLGDGSRYGVRIHHVEEKTPLGTAGSVKNSESLIDETFAVVQGDNQFEFSPKEIVQLHKKLGASATLALVQVDNPSEYGIAELSEGRITRFLEKPKPGERFSNLINSGFYVLEPEVLKLVPEGRPFDFSRNLFPLMLESKMTLAGFHARGFWVDIGDPKSYLKANTWALEKLELKTAPANNKIACGSDTWISANATLRGPVYLGDHVRIEKSAVIGPHVSISDTSEVMEDARIASSVVLENTRIGANATLEAYVVAEDCTVGNRAKIERNAIVGAGTELGHDSHLAAESKVGPWILVNPHATVDGIIAPFRNHLERVCSLLEKSNAALGLSREEAGVCAALSELGQADAETVSRMTRLPVSRMHEILSELQKREMVYSFGDALKMFTLAVQESGSTSKRP